MDGNMCLERHGEGLAEQDVAILAALPLIDSDLAVLQVHIGNLHVAQLADPESSEEQQPKHQSVLHIVGTIHDLIAAPKLVSVQHVWQFPTLLRRSKLANLPDLLGDIAPAVVVEPGLTNDPGDLGDDPALR